jgi:hypothetical protein
MYAISYPIYQKNDLKGVITLNKNLKYLNPYYNVFSSSFLKYMRYLGYGGRFGAYGGISKYYWMKVRSMVFTYRYILGVSKSIIGKFKINKYS